MSALFDFERQRIVHAADSCEQYLRLAEARSSDGNDTGAALAKSYAAGWAHVAFDYAQDIPTGDHWS